MMRTPAQPKEHPDYWVIEAIDHLLKPVMDYPTTSKYLTQKHKQLGQQNHSCKRDLEKYPLPSHSKTSPDSLRNGKILQHSLHQDGI